MTFPRRGEIYLVSSDPTVGHEIQKTRPALIVQNDISNEHSPITIVAAITSHFSDPPRTREDRSIWTINIARLRLRRPTFFTRSLGLPGASIAL